MDRILNGHIFLLSVVLILSLVNDWKTTNTNGLTREQNNYQLEQQSDSLCWYNIKSVEDLWSSYPQHIRFLMERLDLTRSGLSKVRHAIQIGDTVDAAKALLSYYSRSESGFWLRNLSVDSVSNTEIKKANLLLKHTVSYTGKPVAVPDNNEDGWKWTYKGPNKDNEFAYKLNGHEYLISLLNAWKSDRDPKYVETFDRIIKDWILHNPLPAKEDSMYIVLNTSTETLDWRDISEVRWRDIEAGVRMGATWPQMFYGFQQSKSFTPATRLLMLSSIAEHAEFLKKYHKKTTNWVTIEMDGLALAGLAFPEFKDANSWTTYALKIMQREINNQVYPDGTQTELSTKTQWVALKRFESLADNFRKANQSVPKSYIKRLEDMYNYLAYAMRPDGHQPLNNDSDRENLRPRVLKAAEKYDRPDWQWIATNGSAGQEPSGLPSKTFPWAGIHIMRSGWDQDAHWAFFDTGPFGTGHQHSDKLHLSVTAYGKDLLVDGGRYTHENYFSFDPSTWRGYFRSSYSHNVILIDGHGQTRESNTVDAPLEKGVDYMNTQAFDYAQGIYTGGFAKIEGKAEHNRRVLYFRDKYWVVVDHISTDRPRKIQALWHYGSGLPVQKEGKQMVSTNAKGGNLRIVPVGWDQWSIELIKGQTEPVIQGWYSAEYGKKEPIQTAVYTTKIEDDAVFVWVLVPANGKVQPVHAKVINQLGKKVKILIEGVGESPDTVEIPLGKGVNPTIK